MNQLEKYLNNATRGLFGKQKLEVREELEAHVLERVRKHELSGLPREAAILKTLEELGNARAINQKMTEVHTMPTLLKSMLTTMFAVFAFMTSATNPAGAVHQHQRSTFFVRVASEQILEKPQQSRDGTGDQTSARQLGELG
jgi:hypothetical protein